VGSVNAVVAAAFTVVGGLVTVPNVGGRTEDILEVVESRDAREPGRSGEVVRVCEVVGPAGGEAEGGDRPDSCLGDIDGDVGGG
jgi:hypothetical protein